jgi:ribulose-5-phosphate 4-epimerase/fuculose-1-phosphate aldolase
MSSVLKPVNESPWTAPRVPWEWNTPSIPGLTVEAEMAMALRMLHADGYDDNYFGHITVALDDGTLLTNPWEIIWDRVRASDMIVCSNEGVKQHGRWSVSPGIGLHFPLRHYARDKSKARVVIHQHPRYSTLWAIRQKVPPIYDQAGAWYTGALHLVGEFSAGEVLTREHAEAIVEGGWALLARHGVLVLGSSVMEAAWRAHWLEYRCRRAWELEGRDGAIPMDEALAKESTSQVQSNYYQQWWESEMHRQVSLDASVLL